MEALQCPDGLDHHRRLLADRAWEVGSGLGRSVNAGSQSQRQRRNTARHLPQSAGLVRILL